MKGGEQFTTPGRGIFERRSSELIVAVLPEGDAAVTGQRRQKVSLIVEGNRTKVDGRDSSGVTTENSDGLPVMKAPDTNNLVARSGR